MSQVPRNRTWQPLTLHTYSIFENIVFLVGLINVFFLCVCGGDWVSFYHFMKSFLGPKWTSPLALGKETSRPSMWLETSLFRFGLKIAILGRYRGILGAFWCLVWAPQNIFLPKWTPPSLLALKSTILGQFSPLWGFGNIIFKIGPQNSHFDGFYGHFMGP